MRRPPKLCHHKGVEQGYVWLNGRAVYLGAWPRDQKRPPHKVQSEYDRILAQWLESKPEERVSVGQSPTVTEAWIGYWAHVQNYYRKNGKPTSEVGCIKVACRELHRMFGEKRISKIGIPELRDVRDAMVEKGWTRKSINTHISRIRMMFKWAVGEGLIPGDVYRDLQLLAPLKRGRTNAKEKPPIKPVAWEQVEKTLPFLPEVMQAMVKVHYLLGCRSQDVVQMRPCDLDRSSEVWLYTPPNYKTEHHDEDGEAPLLYWVGPKAQEILKPMLEAMRPEDWIFSTKSIPSRRTGAKGCYSTASYRRRITETCTKQGLPRWVPLQLRHARLTEIRKQFGIEAAQTVAMHKNLSTTEIYAEKTLQRSKEIMGKIG